jgi:tRNA dimethylallyltransferase
MAAPQKTVIAIAGPTAVGKTAVAIDLAKHLGAEIISFDSRQCYRELLIGVARPSREELALVPHHFIASHSIHEKVNAAVFEQYALAKAEELFRQHHTIVLVGGTGLYLQAFTDGMDVIPEVPEALRQELAQQYREQGMAWLQSEVAKHDPAYYSQGETANPHRMLRALEVALHTGQSILQFQQGKKAARSFEVIRLALELPREILYGRINRRVDGMMEGGLLAEVEGLLPFRHQTALQTVGYRELFEYLEGSIALDEAVLRIKQHTRQYAKRQLTWFRRDERFQWLPPDGEEVIKLVGKIAGF